MAWTDPKTWVAGDGLTAAELNTHVRDNLDYLHDKQIEFAGGGGLSLTTSYGAVAPTTAVTVAAGTWLLVATCRFNWAIGSLGEIGYVEIHDGSDQVDEFPFTYPVLSATSSVTLIELVEPESSTTYTVRGKTSGLDGTQLIDKVKIGAFPSML